MCVYKYIKDECNLTIVKGSNVVLPTPTRWVDFLGTNKYMSTKYMAIQRNNGLVHYQMNELKNISITGDEILMYEYVSFLKEDAKQIQVLLYNSTVEYSTVQYSTVQ